MAKVINIDIYSKKYLKPLSTEMKKSLQKAYQKQLALELFGPSDIGGSFLALFNRDLIGCKTIVLDGKQIIYWFVTKEGVKALQRAGLRELC